MPELVVFGDPSEEEVVISVDGEDAFRFGLDEYGVWEGAIKVNDGVAIIRADYYVSNPNGWLIRCLSKNLWECTEEVQYNDSYASDEDYYLVFQIPRGLVDVKEKGYYA